MKMMSFSNQEQKMSAPVNPEEITLRFHSSVHLHYQSSLEFELDEAATLASGAFLA
jgi:hypothetical protein